MGIPLLIGAASAALLLARAADARRERPTAAAARRGRPHRVVVIGAGFGGLAAAADLAGVPGVEVTVLDRRNHHLFQPMLYQVATAVLSPDDIAQPIRGLLAPEGVRVRVEQVTGVDTRAREVLCDAGSVPYDTLVVATGSEVSYFGHDDWAEAARGLKDLDDAIVLRRHILDAFEQAAAASDPAERERLLTFVLVGGGPTGVEMAGSVAELARTALPRDYPAMQAHARIVLVEAGPTLLGQFAPELSRYTADVLRGLGVDIRTGTPVTGIEPGLVRLGDEALPAGTVIWTAGVRATPVARWLGVAPGRGGQVPVGPDLSVPGRPEVFVVGDAALALGRDGEPLPGLAAVAKQQGRYVARAIRRRLRGAGTRPFGYRDYGALAIISRNQAVAELGPVRLTGFLAALLWAVVHIFFLIGFRNRTLVGTQWLITAATHQRAGTIIR